MRRAVELAKKAGDETRPNPRVGAILVKGGRVVGMGYHRRAGEPHAEAMALHQAGTQARGADLYVTLEPCSTHGRTPPCTGAIRRAGVRRVIYGASDVDPRNAGRSDRVLREAGIRVTRGVMRKECERLNEDYRHWTLKKEPWVILKLAMTLDGALALPGRRWITGPEARAEVQRLRAGCDAILVGAETVRKDNPRLTIRGSFRQSAECRRVGPSQPWRVVVTKSGRLPRLAKIFRDDHRQRTLIYRNKNWDAILGDLYRRGVFRLLVEGGAKTAKSLHQSGKVGEWVYHLSPVKGGGPGPRWTGWPQGREFRFRRLGKDAELRFLASVVPARILSEGK